MTNKMTGLTHAEAETRLLQYGYNEIIPEKEDSIIKKFRDVITEPMFILLLAAAAVYLLLGNIGDGVIMLVFVVFIISIDFIQEWRTDRTIKALRDLTSPKTALLRGGISQSCDSRFIVPGDIALIVEGERIPADGYILDASDFCVDESALTGESEPVWKKIFSDTAKPDENPWRRDMCYAGTVVQNGSAKILVTQTGKHTEYGKIGGYIAEAPDIPTPLQKQNARLVRNFALLGAVFLILVAIITWTNLSDSAPRDRIISSLLAGITLAMGIIPEEFPVILAVFLSMGAWRLARKNALVRKLPSVETLGQVSVLCVDKTGTLTENRMKVTDIHTQFEMKFFLTLMGRACEITPHDPMESAMLEYCESCGISGEILFSSGKLIHEYPFTPETKRMGHVWKLSDGKTVLICKGSPESVLPLCSLDDTRGTDANSNQAALASEGLRVIALGFSMLDGNIPESLDTVTLEYAGLIGLSDPPRTEVPGAVKVCAKAGVRIVMITGDNGETAHAVAHKIGLNHGEMITGAQMNNMSDSELMEILPRVNVMSRVIPEQKMRIVRLLKELGEVVAMTGDGVNDAPALKYADIGIAMGGRGAPVARESADLILMDDNFTTIVDTIRDGRRIYRNIQKSIQYVLTVHIPIALIALFAPLAGITPDAVMLLPMHIVLLELIIDPTCSILFERLPVEANIMERPPRGQNEPLVGGDLIFRGVWRGLILFLVSFGEYIYMLKFAGFDAAFARSSGFAVLIAANLFLVLASVFDTLPIFKSIAYMSRDRIFWFVTGGIGFLFILVFLTPLCYGFKLVPLNISQVLRVIPLGLIPAVIIEMSKFVKSIR